MVNYTPHYLVAFGGDFVGETGEGWECTLRVTEASGGDVLDPVAYLAAIKTPLSTWFAAATSKMTVESRLSWIKCNRIGPDGRYSDKANSHRTDYATPVSGSASSAAPAFISLAYTWETGNARGRAHRGRMYPPSGYNCSSAMQVSTTDRDAAAAAGKALLAVFANAAGSNVQTKPMPSIYSGLDATVHAITGVSVNSTYDVQRRRKAQVKGTRSAIVAFP